MDYIFDTHAHYDDEAFDEDRLALLSQMPEGGVRKIVNIGASIETCHKSLELLHLAKDISGLTMYCALGVHPDEVGGLNDETAAWLQKIAAEEEKCVAIGEIGLDYHWDTHPRELQKEWFIWQLDLARQLHKPVVIHSRDACQDTMDIMKSEHAEEMGGVIHCFSYSPEIAQAYVDMGFYIGVGGVLTYKNARKLVETVEAIPLERIVLETDCPYLSPVPHRGERNSSLNIPHVVEKIAELKKVSAEDVCRITWENAHKLYRLSM